MLSHGPVHTTMDFDSVGKRSGFCDLQHSDNDHAFSAIRVPIGVIRGGAGPTLLLTAGSHGDEYEGQVILHRVMQDMNPEDLQGRIILLPALNTPAVRNRARVSPLDSGNMNRSFSPDAHPGPTAAIAAFVSTHLIPMADVILDFHSGGSATEYVDCGFLCVGSDTALNSANMELAQCFGAPFTMVCPIDGHGGDFDTAAHKQQTRFLSCELGGLGRFSRVSCQVGQDGLRRILAHLGMIPGPTTAPPTRFIDIAQNSSFVTAAHHGLVEMHVSTGDNVNTSDVLATLHDMHNLSEVRSQFLAPHTGIIAITRRTPVVAPGDHICLLCKELAPEEVL